MNAIEASFRQECLKNVEDSTPWLVFSDWLEENGQSALAAAYRNRRFRNSIGMEFVLVPAGSFWMGGGGSQPGKKQVAVAHDLYVGVYPVTQEQWQALMGNNPSYFSREGAGRDRVESIADAELKQFPVECVSRGDAKEFIRRLHHRETSSKWIYRLPTEVEWEYACRGGPATQHDCSFHYYFDQPSNDLSSDQANFDGHRPFGAGRKGTYLQRTTRVGSYKPNRLGIHDMHGNVWEWCQDVFQGFRRVARGGCWLLKAKDCQAPTAADFTRRTGTTTGAFAWSASCPALDPGSVHFFSGFGVSSFFLASLNLISCSGPFSTSRVLPVLSPPGTCAVDLT